MIIRVSHEPQCALRVLMIRPARFGANSATAESNRFQSNSDSARAWKINADAVHEFDGLAAALERAGVEVCVVDDTIEPEKPDAIFPNNWVSLHADGTVVLYPMLAVNRRLERRLEVLEQLGQRYGLHIDRTIDLTAHERAGQFLEGTGSLVLDRTHRLAFACLSPRTNLDALGDFAQQLDYEIVSFEAYDSGGVALYHTNVLMCIGERFAVLCASAIADAASRAAVCKILETTGHELIEISHEQMSAFAGNMLELESTTGRKIIAMSTRALESLSAEQRKRLEHHGQIVSAPIPTIEKYGGGSVRCMLAEIHLPRRA